MPNLAISLKNAALSLNGNAGLVDILHSVSIDIVKGETVGLVGPSGSGKSSLLMIMAGLEETTGGSITVLGLDLTKMNENALAHFRSQNMGVVFQSFNLIPTMTALENVATALEIAGVRNAHDRARAELQAVGLKHRLHHYPNQLSGGEQQRVAIARALVNRPAILLADEPTGNLDGTNSESIMDLLFTLRDRHETTLVLVTHAPELAARCDRTIQLADGRILSEEAIPA